MDTPSLIALIIIALVILAVIIAFRQKISLTLKAWGIDLGLKAENPAPQPPVQPATSAPAGVDGVDRADLRAGHCAPAL